MFAELICQMPYFFLLEEETSSIIRARQFLPVIIQYSFIILLGDVLDNSQEPKKWYYVVLLQK
jgi:hypothetical protein